MAKASPFQMGPYLSAAFLCERVLEERDGVKSIVRIVDRMTRSGPPLDESGEMETWPLSLSLFVRLKAGWARGPLPLEIRLIKPSGETPSPMQRMIYFEGEEDRGVDVVVNLTLEVNQTGIYWFEIWLAQEMLTKVPMRIIYMPVLTQTGGTGGTPPSGQEPPPNP